MTDDSGRPPAQDPPREAGVREVGHPGEPHVATKMDPDGPRKERAFSGPPSFMLSPRPSNVKHEGDMAGETTALLDSKSPSCTRIADSPPRERRTSSANTTPEQERVLDAFRQVYNTIDITGTGSIPSSALLSVMEDVEIFRGLPSHVNVVVDVKRVLTSMGLCGDAAVKVVKEPKGKTFLPRLNSRMNVNKVDVRFLISKEQFEVFISSILLSWSSSFAHVSVRKEGIDRLEEIRDAFHKCDLDKSGEVELDELRSIMAHMGQVMNDSEVEKLLEDFDHDGNGLISWEEFLKTMCRRDRQGINSALSLDALMEVPSFMMNSCSDQPPNLEGLNPLEKYGMKFLQWRHGVNARIAMARSQFKTMRRRLSSSVGVNNKRMIPAPPFEQKCHVLTKESLRRIRSIERTAIALAIFAGVLSAGASGIVEVVVAKMQKDDDSNGGLLEKVGVTREAILYVLPVVLVFSILEIFIMYSTGLGSALDITAETGLKLFPEDSDRVFITAALARAALQVGNPKHVAYGVDPTGEVSKSRLLLVAAVYMGKKGLTTVFLKLMLKRVFVRAAAKSVLSFVAVPVNGLWNAFVMMLVMREIRVCSIGPSFVYASISDLLKGHDTDAHSTPALNDISYPCRVQMIRAVGICIINKKELHPNLETTLRLLRSKLMDKTWLTPKGCRCLWLGVQQGTVVCPLEEHNFSSTHMFLDQLENTRSDDPHINEERKLVMAVVVLCLIIDGSVSMTERKLYKKCIQRLGDFPDNWEGVEDLCERFKAGKDIETMDILDLFVSKNCEDRTKLRITRGCNKVLDLIVC